ncbi:MAG TPA: outer membrane lipoprotein carrier protein LolA [Desulfobacteraceae bacterium]|nr:outer membrane lipoprotein carrier protein LolA [Desulfobacteraceae bacterium]
MEKNAEDNDMNNKGIKIYILIIIPFLILFHYPPLLFSSEEESQQDQSLIGVIENIKKKEKDLKTFTAKFIQKKETNLLLEPLHSDGMIYFDSAGKLLMKVINPYELIILVRDGRLVIYYPSSSKVEDRYLGSDFIKRFFGIGQSLGELENHYRIRLVSDNGLNSCNLELKPKLNAMAKHIDLIDITVNKEKWLPEKISFKETKGDSTTLLLDFVSVNEPLPPGIFEIDFPYSVENTMH